MIRQNASININTGADNTVIAGVTGQPILVWDLVLLNAVATAQVATVKDNTAGNTLAVLPLPSSIGGGVAITNDNNPQWVIPAGNPFVIALANATAVQGFVQYTLG